MAKFMNAFIAMQMQKEDVKSHVQETCIQFEKVLALKPDYHEAMLYWWNYMECFRRIWAETA